MARAITGVWKGVTDAIGLGGTAAPATPAATPAMPAAATGVPSVVPVTNPPLTSEQQRAKQEADRATVAGMGMTGLGANFFALQQENKRRAASSRVLG